MADISASRDIAAPPEAVWALVSDITRMGEWSPESTGGTWLKGASGPAVGAKFKGTNEAGGKKWSTTCEITECVPGERFTFEVKGGPFKVATWSYDFAPSAAGTLVTESWTDQRHPILATIFGKVTGVTDRAAHNRTNIEQTLDALDRAATASS
jgi:uncharacterized protein YndB with AHSA1/START domain